MKNHNTHVLIPEDLWRRVVQRAGYEGTTSTAIICKSLRRYLKNRTSRRAQ